MTFHQVQNKASMDLFG